ncbi:hypothetical protein AN958_00374 [Leucoagaricus sp. SymC.cos]|nr:hypothetical protein AN958_00374 [Leucoagaricus sp. SymC.cos]
MTSLTSRPSIATNSVVYPPPPPTTNTLTLEQRAQLRKSTKKLGQILGATPHLLDTDIVSILGPVHISLPPRNETPSSILSESSSDSYSSRSSSSCSVYPIHPYAACSSPEHESFSTSSLPSRQRSFCLKSSSRFSGDNIDATNTQAPTLRLAVNSPPSPTSSTSSYPFSASSSPSKASVRPESFDSHIRANSLNDISSTTTSASDMKFTLRPARHSTSTSINDESISEPTFHVPSSSSVRRQKMDRLRRVLGDEVPVHLVFPEQKLKSDSFPLRESEATAADGHSSFSGSAPVAVAGTATPRPKKTASNKIVGARDSMGSLTPHRAKRQEKAKTEKTLSPSTPSPSVVIPEDPSQKQLCVIVESPEEHGSSSFEGFGFGKPSKKPSVVVQSSWHVRDGLACDDSGLAELNKVWSTRKGYTGWDRSIVVGAPKPESERKRAMSYRKPPPPIDF